MRPAPDPVPELPAPWSLTGSGYVVALPPPRADASFLDASSAATLDGSMAWLMFVDYTSSDCGPYRELLYIPGRCVVGDRPLRTISRIFVSTEASVVNGRRNWGIPKERADFEVTYGEGGVDRVRVSLDGKAFAQLEFRAFGPQLPCTTAMMPKSWRTLGQRYGGRRYVYTPSASGRLRLARLVSAWTDPAIFPGITASSARLTLRTDRFAMTFPTAAITDA